MVVREEPQIILSPGALEIINPVARAQLGCPVSCTFSSLCCWPLSRMSSAAWWLSRLLRRLCTRGGAGCSCRKLLRSRIEVHGFTTHYVQTHLNLEDLKLL